MLSLLNLGKKIKISYIQPFPPSFRPPPPKKKKDKDKYHPQISTFVSESKQEQTSFPLIKGKLLGIWIFLKICDQSFFFQAVSKEKPGK